MELKNLFGKIQANPEAPQQFLAIEIANEIVKTAVWQVVDQKTKVVSAGSVEEWKTDSTQDLLTAIDHSLSKALESIETEPSQTIFGLPESWASTEGIADAKKDVLKTITDKLSLTPIGFVVSTEAMVHYFRIKEGGPPSLIFLNLSETEVTVTVVNLGTIEGSEIVGRSEDICADVEEGLARFTGQEHLPARMVIYDGNLDLETIKQNLISYDWLAKLSFLHFPQIDTLSRDASISAIAIAGGSEVARSLGIPVAPPPDEEEPVVSPAQPSDNSAEMIGQADQISPDTSLLAKLNPLIYLQRLSPKLPSSSSLLSSSKNLFRSLPLPPMIITGILLLIIFLIIGFIAYWQLPTATVTIYLKPQEIDKDIEFTLDPTLDILDAENASLPAAEKAIEIEGEKEAATTGEKLVGERATGKVEIFNRTQSEKTFPAGTILSVDTFNFTLDETVSVASASTQENSDFSTTTVPSSAEGTVTAVDIGDNYNFAADTQLAVANFASSSFVAKADSDFTGGFSREIKAVSEADHDELRLALIEELTQQAAEDVSTESNNQLGIVQLEEVDVIDENFSADVGDEAEKIRVTMRVRFPIYTYQLADLSLLLKDQNQADIPEGQTLSQDDLEVEVISPSLNDDGTISVTAKAKLKLISDLNEADIIQNIKGRYPPQTQEYFASLPNFSRLETKFNTSLPARLKTFPRKADNITIEVKIEDKPE